MKNLMVIHNKDTFTERILKTIRSLFNNDKNDDYCRPDLLLCDEHKGNISNENSLNNSLIDKVKPYVKNIFTLINSKITWLNNYPSINDLIYDNIIYFPISIGTAFTNNIIYELNIKYGKKIILPSDDDIDRFYILNILNEKNRRIIDHFVLDCGNIIAPPMLVNFLPFKNRINILFYTFPVDFTLYNNNELKNFESELNLKNHFNNLEMQLFTKPQPLQATVDALKLINKNQKYIRNLGLFPIITISKKVPFFIIEFLREIKKFRASLGFFLRERPLKTYYSQLETYNSLYIQRRGGMTTIKYAIIKGLLIFGDFQTPNGKILINDYGIKILNLRDFNKGLYTKQELANIIHANRSNMIQIVEKSEKYWYNLFSSKNVLENFKNL